MLRACFYMLFILLAPMLAHAEEPTVNDEAEIREAEKLFLTAVYTGNHEDIAKLFAGTPEELVSIKIFNSFCTTNSRSLSSCKKRWPNENMPENPDPAMAVEKILSMTGKPRIVGGTQASYDEPNTRTLSKVDGKWKVTSMNPQSKWESLDLSLYAAQKALGSIVGEIESGKFDSYAQMKVEAQKRVDQAAVEIKAKYEVAREKAKSSGYIGKFSDGKVDIEISRAADNTYAGTLTWPGKSFELTATETDGHLSGSVKRGEESQAFTTGLDGNKLLIHWANGGVPTVLARKIPRPNLLEK